MRNGFRGSARVGRKPSGKQLKELLTSPIPGADSFHIRSYLEGLNTPRSLAVWLIYESGDHRDLKTLTHDFDAPHGADRFRRDYLATKLLQKSKDLRTGIDKSSVAVVKALEAERHNKLTTERLMSGNYPGAYGAILFRAKQLIASVLGPLTSDVSNSIFRSASAELKDPGWSTGRNTAVDHLSSIAPLKYQASLDCTARCRPLAMVLVNSSPHWAQAALGADGPCSVIAAGFNIVGHNVATTVPKNAWIDRFIAYEPALNGRLQRAVGVYIRSRLLTKCGINLRDQTINQSLARFAARTGFFATLDLSAASDTLTCALMQEVLSYEWYDLLDRMRVPSTLYPDGLIRRNWKFSSMGNGFTFELETLVFWAICTATCPSSWAYCYGDDIIVPTPDVEAIIEAFEFCGFKINRDKSFWTGRFRESCGVDVIGLIDCTAPRADEEVSTPLAIVRFHNAIFRSLLGHTWADLYWSRLLRKYRTVLHRHLSAELLRKGLDDRGGVIPLGPHGSGDGSFHVNLDECTPSRNRDGWDGWSFKHIVARYPKRAAVDSISDWLDDGEVLIPPTFTLRDRVTGSTISSAALLCCYLGPRPTVEGDPLGDCSEPIEMRVRHDGFQHNWPSVIYT